MLEGKTKVLEIAARVLKPETLKAVSKAPYTLQGWNILDRWAMNSPAQLKALESKGEIVLLSRLLEQQETESGILLEQIEAKAAGLADHEILQMNQVQTELM